VQASELRSARQTPSPPARAAGDLAQPILVGSERSQDSRPSVSVIVPAYGVAHLLGEALVSLLAQSRPDWEAIVIDDGAPDDVAAAFAPFAGDRRFRLLRTDNQGLATARNRAIGAARAPFVALLDGDDRYMPDYLEQMLAEIHADPGLGFVSCDAAGFGAGGRAGSLQSELYPMSGPVSLERVLSREINIFVAAIIRRTALEEVGGFDGRLRAVEDLDLWIRLLSAGWRGKVLTQVLASYRRRPGSLSTDARPMLAATCEVYEKASFALQERPEGEVAKEMLGGVRQRLRWVEGEEKILRGDVSAGLLLLSDGEQRSPRWRLALALMRRAPGLAVLLVRLRTRLPILRAF
jgi:cellulose synthase/poly-beta-1,6-N-acetylglucosamine synthase-like glycosyltransferase